MAGVKLFCFFVIVDKLFTVMFMQFYWSVVFYELFMYSYVSCLCVYDISYSYEMQL